jgi:hypothetical protein
VKTLKAVGYWYYPSPSRLSPEERFPDPRRLVRPNWAAGQRGRIAAYLRSGKTYAHWRGFSFCRFRCGTRPSEMGSRCLTDGIWVWPEGLAHYVECHGVHLPSEFVRTMRRRNWRIPARAQTATRAARGEPDYSFWLVWAEKQAAQWADSGARAFSSHS